MTMKRTLRAPAGARAGAGQADSESATVRPVRPGNVVSGVYSFSVMVMLLGGPFEILCAAAVFLGLVACLILAQTTLISDKTAAANVFVRAWRLNINKAMCLGASRRALLRWVHCHVGGGRSSRSAGADPIAPILDLELQAFPPPSCAIST